MKHLKFIYFLFAALIFVSCNSGGGGSLLPKIAGRTGEVVVVMEKAQWNGTIGDTLRNVLAQAYPALPQYEPSFDLINIPPAAFSKTFQLNRNIIILKMNDEASTPELKIQRNVWAQPQAVVNIHAKTADEVVALIDEKGEQLFQIFESAERNRTMRIYKSAKNTTIDQKLRKKYHLGLTVPSNFKLDVDSTDFIWMSNETPETSQGIFIYFYDYTDQNTFTKEFLIEKRNQFLESYVPGPVAGSYMTTETQFPVQFNEYSYMGEHYIAVMRGLYKVENAFMGGPFISLTTLDEQRNRVVTFEGYAYAPRKDKRNFVRQLEAILFSFEIIPPEENQKQQEKK